MHLYLYMIWWTELQLWDAKLLLFDWSVCFIASKVISLRTKHSTKPLVDLFLVAKPFNFKNLLFQIGGDVTIVVTVDKCDMGMLCG